MTPGPPLSRQPGKNMNGFRQDKIRILVLDDHPVVRRGIRQILAEGLNPLEFGEAPSGSEGLGLALGQPWDLVVAFDLSGRGAEVLTELKKMRPDQPVFAVIVRGNDDQAEAMDSPDDLVSAVRRILAGGTSGQRATAMDESPGLRGRPGHENLSEREREVLHLISLGKPLKEVAAVLALSEKTISAYRSRILTKLELKSTADLIRYGVMNGLAD